MVYNRSMDRKSLSPEMRKITDKGIRKAVKEISAHMAKDRWDLDAKHYSDEIIYKIFGFYLHEYLMWAIWSGVNKINPKVKLMIGQDAPPTVFTLNGKKHSKLYYKMWQYYSKASGKDKLIKKVKRYAKNKAKTSRAGRRRNRAA